MSDFIFFATSFPALENSLLLNYLLFLYLITLMSFTFRLFQPISAKSCTAYSKFLSLFLLASVNTIIYLHIIRDLAGLRFVSVFIFYLCLSFLSFTPIFLYICYVSFNWTLNIILLLTLLSSDTKIIYPSPYIDLLSFVPLSFTP